MASRPEARAPEASGRLSHLPRLRERRTASDDVADALRRAIVIGRFADGEELNQVELAEHFNVSRVPIREALRQLQAEGLVAAEAHRRTVVVGFTRERIAEVFAIRARLESFMLERSAPKLGPDDLADLRALCDEMDATDDRDVWHNRNHAFHHALLAPSGAGTAMGLVEQLSMQVERYRRRSGGADRSPEPNHEHRSIVAALARGEGEEAARMLEAHILHSLDRVLAALPDDEPRDAVAPSR